VIIDDSIVRGTTLKMSIIKMMDRLNPKNSCCFLSAANTFSRLLWYDMAKLEGLVAFKAALSY
jgi:amidophosphoribosyltransferase